MTVSNKMDGKGKEETGKENPFLTFFSSINIRWMNIIISQAAGEFFFHIYAYRHQFFFFFSSSLKTSYEQEMMHPAYIFIDKLFFDRWRKIEEKRRSTIQIGRNEWTNERDTKKYIFHFKNLSIVNIILKYSIDFVWFVQETNDIIGMN